MIPHSFKLTILHLAYLTWHLVNLIVRYATCSYYFLLSHIEQANKTHDNISREKLRLSNIRIPNHIALSFSNEVDQLDLGSIARLLCWCKQLGINNITLYDEIGQLKDKRKKLFKHVELKLKSSFGCEKPIDDIEGLNIISRLDGRQKFVEDVRELVQTLKPDEINVDSVDRKVGWSSDPELLIIFGVPLCLYGFPPWQLRLTEIFSIPTHRKIPQKSFIDCLERYSKTSQRVGV